MIRENGEGYYSTLNTKLIFKREQDAINYDNSLLLKEERNSLDKDSRRLNDLIEIWYRLHGKTLRDHIRLRKLLYRISDELKNPIASKLTSEQFAEYRERRAMNVTLSTVNREHSYLRAMFNELDRLRVISFKNPLNGMRQFKEREGMLRYLTKEEQANLLNSCKYSSNSSLIYVVKVCLATGARWSEAERLKANQIQKNLITFTDTKSGKNRSIPINDILFNELKGLNKNDDEKLFLSCISAFRKAIKKSKIYLPTGQMTHVLRHSFASHFMSKNGNILVLQEILGHTELVTTRRYAHLAPSHLHEVLKFNPLNQHQHQHQ